MSKHHNIHIFTTNGMEGACSAAIILRKFPQARINITSGYGIATRISVLVQQAAKPDFIHICGVGINRDLPELLAGLTKLKSAGTTIYWYCGRGYLSQLEAQLLPYCETVFKSKSTNSQVIFDHLELEADRVNTRLLRLAKQSCQENKKPDADQIWHHLVQYSNQRFFNTGDRESTVEAIHILADHAHFSSELKEKVTKFQDRETVTWFLGNSPVSKAIRQTIKRVAQYNKPVLLLGPSGVGKEYVARAIHNESPRQGALRPVNCAMLNIGDTMANDELFGHEKDSFTGAHYARAGAFETASGGTLFLDELGELSALMQARFLRVIEDGLAYPVGSDKPKSVDVRIIAATNRNLPDMIQKGKFREDLFYRLNVLVIRIPPLSARKPKDRRLDLEPVYKRIRHELRSEKIKFRLAEKDWRAILEYHWPGNIRQFRNVLERAAYLGASVTHIINEEKAPFDNSTSNYKKEVLNMFRPADTEKVLPLSEIEKNYVGYVYNLFDQNITRTARALGMAPNTLRAKLKKI
ncbi:sigma 54-interacting transcriptional regulator [candidate division CSSED10-310 bacterium]|uniref:Sigma 54-interacting transcriptional regulator n=1 Tax=candidate division CSSED10-310 bacterium TaxID=2855610 RepID=A0ABV6YXF7_UNCC1